MHVHYQREKKRECNEGQRERGEHQRQRRDLQKTTNSYSPSKVAKEWGNIQLNPKILKSYLGDVNWLPVVSDHSWIEFCFPGLEDLIQGWTRHLFRLDIASRQAWHLTQS